MFDDAHDIRIEGGNMANIAGSSNHVIFVRQELGVGVFVFLLVAFLFFRSL